MKPTAADIDSYIATFPPETQELLEQMRTAILEEIPDAEQCINYGMPGFRQGKIVVWFAGYKGHIGFYPSGSGIEGFNQKLTDRGIEWSKGAIRFPLDQPLPLDLVREITAWRREYVREELAQKKSKAKKATVK